MRAKKELKDWQYSALQKIEHDFIRFLRDNKSYSSDSFNTTAKAIPLSNRRVQADMILRNPETGEVLAAIIFCEKAEGSLKSYWAKVHKQYDRSNKWTFYMVFSSVEVGFRILQLTNNNNWVAVIKSDFPNVSELMTSYDYRTMDDPTNWEAIDDRFKIISQQLKTVNTVTEYNQIGMGCRKVLDGISRMISQSIQGIEGCADISPTDLNRNFEHFCSSNLSGKNNEDLRKLVKSTYAFAAVVAHRDLPTLSDARICYYAVLNLSDIIKELLESLKD